MGCVMDKREEEKWIFITVLIILGAAVFYYLWIMCR